MKGYTDLEQSRKLAEILPSESADMRYGYIAPYDYSDRIYDGGYDEVPYPKDFLKKNPNFSENEYDGELPAWSLAALMAIIPNIDLTVLKDGTWVCSSWGKEFKANEKANNPIDTCYKMIIGLKEEGLL